MDNYTQGDTPIPVPPYRLFRKATYATSEWTAIPHADLLSISDGANRTAQILVRTHAGDIQWEGANEAVYEPIVDWLRTFIKVEVYGRNSDGTPDFGSVIERWIGIVTDDGRDPLGKDGGGFAAKQTMLVQGLEYLLDRVQVLGSYIVSNDPASASTTKVAVRVDTPMTFNSPRTGVARWDRNKAKTASTTVYLGPGSPATLTVASAGAAIGETGVFALDMAGDDTEEWTLPQILNHLVSFFGPKLNPANKTFRLTTLEAQKGNPQTLKPSLAAHKVASFRAEGLSLLDALNSLLRPERGLAWKLVYDDASANGSDGPLIAIFSIQAADVTVGTQTFPKASIRGVVDVTGRRDVRWAVRNSTGNAFGRIVVRGEPVLTCFSLSSADTTLAKGWTMQEETLYATPTGVGVATDTTYATNVSHYRANSRVWSEYVPKADWDFKVKNGTNTGSFVLVNPRFDDAGDLVETPASRSVFEKRFSDWIPVPMEVPSGATKPLSPLYQDMLVVISQGDGGKYINLANHLDPIFPIATYCGPLQDRFGVKIRTNPNDLISGLNISPFSGYTLLNWALMIVTAAFRTENRPSVAKSIDGGDPANVLTIDVEGAQVWLIAPQTVIGLNNDRTLKRYAGNRIARDDRDRLKRVLALAQAWYGQHRRPVTFAFGSLAFDVATVDEADGVPFEVGYLVENVNDTTESGDVNTVVTGREFNFPDATTSIETGFGYQPDFGNV